MREKWTLHFAIGSKSPAIGRSRRQWDEGKKWSPAKNSETHNAVSVLHVLVCVFAVVFRLFVLMSHAVHLSLLTH